MTNPLLEPQNILIDLEAEIEKMRKIWLQIETDNPGFDPVSKKHWLQKQARCWIHGATELSESNELEKWLFIKPPLSDTAKEKAAKCIKCWKAWLEHTDKYYVDFDEFELETPLKNETLYDYLYRIAGAIEKEGKGARLQWRALKSFLAYMRNIVSEEIAFIEHIFPKKMMLHSGRISRKIPLEVYPIPQEIASNILCELAQLGIKDRPNGRLSALESLGLCWMCLTASRLRLPTTLEMLEKVKPTALYEENGIPYINIPTIFGAQKIRVSNRLAKFLMALSNIPSKKPRETILQSPKRSLTRTFDRALMNCAFQQDFGNITYLTFLSSPHHFGNNHRYKPK